MLSPGPYPVLHGESNARSARAQYANLPLEMAPVMSFRAVVSQEGEWLTAQILEYDLATQARSLDDLWYELQRLVVGHVAASLSEGVAPFEGLAPAPQRVWHLYEQSKIPLQPPEIPFDVLKPAADTARPKISEIRVVALAA